MGSTNKTSKVGLNQYIGTDHFRREDYNSDMSKIDAVLKSMDEPIVPSINGSELTIVVNEHLKKIHLKITSDIIGNLTIRKNTNASKPLKMPNGDAVTELFAETMFYDVIEDDAAFYLAPKGGGAKNFFGDGSDGELNTTGNVMLDSEMNGPAIVKQYTNITINVGHTLTVSNPCQGLVLYAKGDVQIDGTISMSKKAALIPNGNIVPMIISNFEITNPYGMSAFNQITLQLQNMKGGNGGNGGYGGASQSYSPIYRSSGGIGGVGRQNLGGFGGGGGGGMAREGSATVGGNGGNIEFAEFGYGPAGEGTRTYQGEYFTQEVGEQKGRPGSNGAGGAGGVNGSGTSSPAKSQDGGKCFGGGGGGSGGATYITNNNLAGSGEYAGGFLVIIAKGSITISSSGNLQANGGSGGAGGNGAAGHGSHTANGGGGGGGAGGGVVLIIHKSTLINNGTIQVNGGNGGVGGTTTVGYQTGEPGGPGTSGTVGTIKTQQI